MIELIYENYVKLSQEDLIKIIEFIASVNNINSEEAMSSKEIMICFKILDDMSDYFKQNLKYVNEIYVNKDDMYIKTLIKKVGIKISKKAILNSCMYALYSGDTTMSSKIRKYVNKDINSNDLDNNPEVISYILEHGINDDESLNKENEKFIYNNDHKIEIGHIYNKNIDKIR